MRKIRANWFRIIYWLKWKMPWNVAKDRIDAQAWQEFMERTTKHIRCSCCHRLYDFMDTGWRFNGASWEHKCPGTHPQSGYFSAEKVTS